jgi:hypothetical protein
LVEQFSNRVEVGELRSPNQKIYTKKIQRASPRRRLAKSQALTKRNRPIALPARSSQRPAPTQTNQSKAKSQSKHRNSLVNSRENRSFTPRTARRNAKQHGSRHLSSNGAQCWEGAAGSIATDGMETQHEWQSRYLIGESEDTAPLGGSAAPGARCLRPPGIWSLRRSIGFGSAGGGGAEATEATRELV